LLQGHERAITQIKYNREGDLLFTASKDKNPYVWFSLNGERLGSFNGHNGTIWCIDVDWQTVNFMSGSADATCKIWDARTGQAKTTYSTANSVRSCGFSYSGNLALYTTDSTLNSSCLLIVRDLRQSDKKEPIKQINVSSMNYSKITSSIWATLEDTIITGHEKGELMLWDMRKSDTQAPHKTSAHSKQVMDLQKDKDGAFVISASKDYTAKVN
jgi:translation initiation factor 3 subunit I